MLLSKEPVFLFGESNFSLINLFCVFRNLLLSAFQLSRVECRDSLGQIRDECHSPESDGICIDLYLTYFLTSKSSSCM